MRKIKIISLMIAGAMIVMFSCTKENNESIIKNKPNECPSCKAGIELANRINKFKERLAYAKENVYKDGDEMTKEEAIENMELLINASHGFPFKEYTERRTDTVSFQLPVDQNGNVATTDISTAYDQMIDLVRDAYVNSGYENKGLILVTLASDPDDNTGQTVNASVTTGNEGEKNDGPFQDCWYYGEDLGMCDGTYYMEKDGGDAIAEVLMENNPVYDLNDCPGPDYHIVLDPQDPIELDGHEFQNSNGEDMIFIYPDDDGIQGFTDEEKKLYAYYMNYYYFNEYEIVYTLVPQSLTYNYPFPEYVLTDCTIKGEQFFDEQNNWILSLHHKNLLTYSLRTWVKDDVIPNPVPIDE